MRVRVDRYLAHACDWHALHHQLLQALWGPRQSPRQCMRCSRFSLCAQLLNLVSRGKGDGPQVFLLNVVSKDGSHLSRGFSVNWKIHIHSFEWEQRLLKRINGKALLRASFQLRINEKARGTYYWIFSIVFQMTISLFLCPVYACADLHSD